MPRLFDNAKRIGRKIGLNDDEGYGVAIFLALIVVAVVVAGFFVSSAYNTKPGYSTIYLLDANQKASDYPEVMIANQNSTFNVFVNVEHHNTEDISYQVQVKITKNLSTYPVPVPYSQVYETGEIVSEGEWQEMVTITENDPGNYAVVFELWQHKDGVLEFTHNYCILNIQIVS